MSAEVQELYSKMIAAYKESGKTYFEMEFYLPYGEHAINELIHLGLVYEDNHIAGGVILRPLKKIP